MDIPSTLAGLRRSIKSLSLREKTALSVLAVVGTFFMVDGLILSAIESRITAADIELTTARQRIAVLSSTMKGVNSESELSQQLLSKRAEVGQLEKALGAVTRVRTLILEKPLPISTLMRSALRTPNSRVVVDGAKILAPTVALPAQGSQPAIFRHGIEVQVRGGFGDLLEYLAQLERDERIFWSGLELATKTYPELSLSFSLYSLSTEEKPNLL